MNFKVDSQRSKWDRRGKYDLVATSAGRPIVARLESSTKVCGDTLYFGLKSIQKKLVWNWKSQSGKSSL